MNYRVLVTGGAGFIGSHLVDALVKGGHDVRVVDSLREQVHLGKIPSYLNRKAEFVKGDVRDKDVLVKCLEGVDVVFHEAAAVGVGQSMYMITDYMDVNTQATALLLEVLSKKEHDVKKLIVASSMSIYGEGAYKCKSCGIVYPKLRLAGQMKKRDWEMKCPCCGKTVEAVPTTEEKPLSPTSIYAISKRDQEEMSLVIGMAYGIPTVALRYFNVYGPRQSLSNPYTGVAAIFSSNIKNNNPPTIFEDGMQSRDFIHVSDIVQANLLVMKKKQADYREFNVGCGKPISIMQMVQELIKLYAGKLKPKITNKYRAGDIRHCYADISRIKKLGFVPRYSFKEGLRDLVEWGRREEAKDLTGKATEELYERNLVEE